MSVINFCNYIYCIPLLTFPLPLKYTLKGPLKCLYKRSVMQCVDVISMKQKDRVEHIE